MLGAVQYQSITQKVGDFEAQIEQPTAPYRLPNYENVATAWICRLIQGVRRLQLVFRLEGTDCALARERVGLPKGPEPIPRIDLQRIAQKRLRGLKDKQLSPRSPLGRNLELLATTGGLTKVERDILAFNVLMLADPALRDFVGEVDDCSDDRMTEILSVALEHEVMEIRAALQPGEFLSQAALVTVESEPVNMLYKLRLLDGLSPRILSDHASIENLLANYFGVDQATRLDKADFEHLKDDFELVASYRLDDERRGERLCLRCPRADGERDYGCGDDELSGERAGPADQENQY
jgi:hypothetical protein